MEAKLREYRAARRRKELIDNAKEKLENTKHKLANIFVPNIFRNMHKEKDEDEVLLIDNEEIAEENVEVDLQPEVEPETSDQEIAEEFQESWKYFTLRWTIYFAIWLTIYLIFLKLQFGAVFFVLSLLVGIYFNTRTKPRKPGEISAYSVFNKDCKSIDGTLKAEQFEREIRYGSGSVR